MFTQSQQHTPILPAKMARITNMAAVMIGIATLGLGSATYAQTGHEGHNHDARTGTTTPSQAPPIELGAPDFIFTEAPDDHVIGSDFAPITMITYASVTCSHCGSWFSNIWPQVKTDLVDSGKIRFILRELPTAPQALSMTGFIMAECAPEEDYIAVIEYQMENQAELFEQAQKGNGAQAYAKVAKIAGLNDNPAIGACLSDPKHAAHVNLSARRAQAANISGVPAFFINGAPYKGDQSAQALSAHIDGLFKTSTSSAP